MKKKLLPLAMLAGLSGTAGPARAVHINPGGLGEVLIYPCPLPELDLEQQVKVRMLEAGICQEVLDFNLYLSPFDYRSCK